MIGVGDTRLQIAIDAVTLDQRAREALGGLAEFPELARRVATNHGVEFDLVLALTAAELAAVAAGSAPAGFARFQQNDVVATLGEVQCRRQTGIATADNTDICTLAAFEHRQLDLPVLRCMVVGVRIVGAIAPVLDQSETHVVAIRRALSGSDRDTSRRYRRTYRSRPC